MYLNGVDEAMKSVPRYKIQKEFSRLESCSQS